MAPHNIVTPPLSARLDEDLKDLLGELESRVLGPWKGLLVGAPTDRPPSAALRNLKPQTTQ